MSMLIQAVNRWNGKINLFGGDKYVSLIAFVGYCSGSVEGKASRDCLRFCSLTGIHSLKQILPVEAKTRPNSPELFPLME
jgi:hypothetical protein